MDLASLLKALYRSNKKKTLLSSVEGKGVAANNEIGDESLRHSRGKDGGQNNEEKQYSSR